MSLGLLLLIAVGCGSSEGSEPEQPTAQDNSKPASQAHPESPEWSVISDGINLELATPDLGVGTPRCGVVMSDEMGLIKFPGVTLPPS